MRAENPANTNIQSWGGQTLALWEAALPCKIDPATLAYEGVETFDGALPSGGLTVTSGIQGIDRALGLGVGFTAHPREDRRRARMVGWSWAAPLAGDSLQIELREWDTASGQVVHTVPATLPSAIAPHDFALTDNWCALGACRAPLPMIQRVPAARSACTPPRMEDAPMQVCLRPQCHGAQGGRLCAGLVWPGRSAPDYGRGGCAEACAEARRRVRGQATAHDSHRRPLLCDPCVGLSPPHAHGGSLHAPPP